MNNKIRTNLYNQRVRLFWVLVSISILSLFVYIYAINAIARNVAVSQDLEKKMTNISTNFNSLEFKFIELRNKVTMELAYQHGFQEVKYPLYISKTRSSSLSFNTVKR
ncbi:MAG: hypothetical protein Q7K26_04800 [bacterium]|nr:hypothetical protein [bacterium]